MITFLNGYDTPEGRINEWRVQGDLVKTTFKEGLVHVLEGTVSAENLEKMQAMVDASVRESEGY